MAYNYIPGLWIAMWILAILLLLTSIFGLMIAVRAAYHQVGLPTMLFVLDCTICTIYAASFLLFLYSEQIRRLPNATPQDMERGDNMTRCLLMYMYFLQDIGIYIYCILILNLFRKVRRLIPFPSRVLMVLHVITICIFTPATAVALIRLIRNVYSPNDSLFYLYNYVLAQVRTFWCCGLDLTLSWRLYRFICNLHNDFKEGPKKSSSASKLAQFITRPIKAAVNSAIGSGAPALPTVVEANSSPELSMGPKSDLESEATDTMERPADRITLKQQASDPSNFTPPSDSSDQNNSPPINSLQTPREWRQAKLAESRRWTILAVSVLTVVMTMGASASVVQVMWDPFSQGAVVAKVLSCFANPLVLLTYPAFVRGTECLLSASTLPPRVVPRGWSHKFILGVSQPGGQYSGHM
ncbi:hypothetical protein DFS34DRAFT_599261 [Phlyctochytrium arcticum]|nr:hypothetical protein DFS34DRAFT_599261 [Phlyctochytrium arcticum]